MDDAPGHVVLLNNDARFAPDAVERLVETLEAPGNERVGAVTAKILLAPADGSTPTTVNSTGNVLTRDGAGTDRDWLTPVGGESTDPEVFGFCGGAALLRREALLDVGGFDPELFLYYEDTDLSWRMRAAGWHVRYDARAVAEHDHAASSGADSPLFRYYNTRNSLLVVTRHAPLTMVLRSTVRQGLGTLLSVAREGLSATARARVRGTAAHVRRLPRTLGERRRLWRDATVSRRDACGAAAR
ncbi:glycosyltransferase family 2 protein [Cellulomonas soli]